MSITAEYVKGQISSLIKDNNSGDVTPAKVRNILNLITDFSNQTYDGGFSVITVTNPVTDPSIPLAESCLAIIRGSATSTEYPNFKDISDNPLVIPNTGDLITFFYKASGVGYWQLIPLLGVHTLNSTYYTKSQVDSLISGVSLISPSLAWSYIGTEYYFPGMDPYGTFYDLCGGNLVGDDSRGSNLLPASFLDVGNEIRFMASGAYINDYGAITSAGLCFKIGSDVHATGTLLPFPSPGGKFPWKLDATLTLLNYLEGAYNFIIQGGLTFFVPSSGGKIVADSIIFGSEDTDFLTPLVFPVTGDPSNQPITLSVEFNGTPPIMAEELSVIKSTIEFRTLPISSPVNP